MRSELLITAVLATLGGVRAAHSRSTPKSRRRTLPAGSQGRAWTRRPATPTATATSISRSRWSTSRTCCCSTTARPLPQRLGAVAAAAHDSEDVAFADFDGDGDLDLVLVSEDDRKDELYLNDGAGRFTDVSDRLVPDDVSNALVVLDLNGDGAPDVLDRQHRHRPRAHQRRHGPVPRRDRDALAAGRRGVAHAGSRGVRCRRRRRSRRRRRERGQNQLYRNDDGVLVDVTATHLPRENDESREVRAADFDGDGDLDLVVAQRAVRARRAGARRAVAQRRQGRVLGGPGGLAADGAATPATSRSRRSTSTATRDVDIVAPNTVFERAAGDYRVLLNDGTARFTRRGAGRRAAARGRRQRLRRRGRRLRRRRPRRSLSSATARRDDDAAASGGVQRLLLGRAR